MLKNTGRCHLGKKYEEKEEKREEVSNKKEKRLKTKRK
jgi:hypothetical protein